MYVSFVGRGGGGGGGEGGYRLQLAICFFNHSLKWLTVLLQPCLQEKLNAVNFQWKPVKGPSPAWEDNLAALKHFKEESGQDADPPRKLTVVRPDGRKLNLGKWCDSQRQARKRKVLSDDQIRRLDELGFAWSFNLVVGWQVYFDALKEYKETHVSSCLCVACFVTPRQIGLGRCISTLFPVPAVDDVNGVPAAPVFDSRHRALLLGEPRPAPALPTRAS